VLCRVSFQSVVYGSDGARSNGGAEADDYKAGKMLRERCGRKVVVAVAGREGE